MRRAGLLVALGRRVEALALLKSEAARAHPENRFALTAALFDSQLTAEGEAECERTLRLLAAMPEASEHVLDMFKAELYRQLNRYERALAFARAAKRKAVRASDARLAFRADHVAVSLLIYTGRMKEAERKAAELRRSSVARSNILSRIEALRMSGGVAYMLRKVTAALRFLRAAGTLARKAMHVEMQAHIEGDTSTILAQHGRFTEALAMMHRATETLELAGHRYALGVNLTNQAHLCRVLGRFDEAVAAARTARGIFTAMNDEYSRAWAGAAEALVLLNRGDAARAAELFDRYAAELFDRYARACARLDNPAYVAKSARYCLYAALALGRHDRYDELLRAVSADAATVEVLTALCRWRRGEGGLGEALDGLPRPSNPSSLFYSIVPVVANVLDVTPLRDERERSAVRRLLRRLRASRALATAVAPAAESLARAVGRR